jgi:cysteine-rich repeat protein
MRISSKLRNVIASLLLAGPIAACGFDTNQSTVLSQHDEVDQCTFTQGYWKNHPEAWPVGSLELGGQTYTQAELLAIFDEPVAGNGAIALAHQLIAAKLNVAIGAPDDDIAGDIAAADALLAGLVLPPGGDGYLHPSVTSDLVDALDAFNNLELSGDACEPDEPEPECGDGNVDEGEECDDGNNEDGDGCSATCETEEPGPSCGDGNVDEGEECDDGNNENGDGCSATCETEKPGKEPCCGDGHVDDGEECDDGNTMDGDGCSATCTVEPPKEEPRCGDGHLDAGEQCDDGNTMDGDGCSATCTQEPICVPAMHH